MRIVGLTGNAAAGKSGVAAVWRARGIPVASMDEFARRAVEPGSEALASIWRRFGPRVIALDGTIRRDVLRRIVFTDAEARAQLEAIVHPEVRRLRDAWTEWQRMVGAVLVAWEAPLLFETGMEDCVDVVVVVEAPAAERLRRLTEDRGLEGTEARAMMEAQDPPEDKAARADFVIMNDGTLSELSARAGGVLDTIRRYEP